MEELNEEVFQGKKILIADDEDFIRVHIAKKLASKGLEVLQAGAGDEVLELAKQMPHVILMDVKMPVIDGIEAARQLKAQKDTASIPLVLLSARAQQEDLDEGYNAGADYYLTKPVTIQQILETIQRCLTS